MSFLNNSHARERNFSIFIKHSECNTHTHKLLEEIVVIEPDKIIFRRNLIKKILFSLINVYLIFSHHFYSRLTNFLLRRTTSTFSFVLPRAMVSIKVSHLQFIPAVITRESNFFFRSTKLLQEVNAFNFKSFKEL